MVVHGGGVYGDKEATLQRWCEQFKLLSENVQEKRASHGSHKNCVHLGTIFFFCIL